VDPGEAAITGLGPAAGREEEDVPGRQRSPEAGLDHRDVVVDGQSGEGLGQLEGVFAGGVGPRRVHRSKVDDQVAGQSGK